MSREPNICYWCGKPVDGRNREHVPPRCLFPEAKRNNLITVPSCTDHNQNFNMLDERFKFAILAGCSNQEATREFETNALRSFDRPEAGGLISGIVGRIHGPLGDLTIDDFQVSLEKVVRGLYFHHCSHPFGGDCFSFSRFCRNMPSDMDVIRKARSLFNRRGLKQIVTTAQPEIFRYEYVTGVVNSLPIFAVIIWLYSDFMATSVLC